MMIEETVNRWVCCMTEQKTNQSCGEAKRPKRILACLKPEYCRKWQGKSRGKQNKQARAGLQGSTGRTVTNRDSWKPGWGQSWALTCCKRSEVGARTAALCFFRMYHLCIVVWFFPLFFHFKKEENAFSFSRILWTAETSSWLVLASFFFVWYFSLATVPTGLQSCDWQYN